MATRQELQRLIRHYKDVTGEREIDMRKVAEFAKKMGMQRPTPPSAIDLMAKKLAEAAREETKRSPQTGRPYRVYHAVPVQLNMFVYVDIDEATRPQMLMSSVNRREQMISDGVNLTDDINHWNGSNPGKEPIQLPMDLELDIAIRKAGDEEDEEEPPKKAA